MCFSSSVSFGAGAVLATVGVACLKKIQQPQQIAFASIPLIFALQQVSEGFVWMAAKNDNHGHLLQLSACTFLFFAQAIWPFWVPLSFLLIERNDSRKVVLYILTGVGALLGFYHLFCLVVYPIELDIAGKHIAYRLNHPENIVPFESAVYLLVTTVPPFFSSIKRMWSLGLAGLLSLLFTALIFQHWVISVWCFFAGIISIMVWFLMDYINDDNEMDLATW
jgi:hypothetical protein